MAASYTSFEAFLSSSSSEILANNSINGDGDGMQKINVEINDLRIALKAAKDALIDEKQQKLKDRKLYEAKVKEIKSFCNDHVLLFLFKVLLKVLNKCTL